MIKLKFMSIRPIPNFVVYNHPVTPEITRREDVHMVPVPGIGVLFKETPPLIGKVEEKLEREVVKAPEKQEKKTAEKTKAKAEEVTAA